MKLCIFTETVGDMPVDAVENTIREAGETVGRTWSNLGSFMDEISQILDWHVYRHV